MLNLRIFKYVRPHLEFAVSVWNPPGEAEINLLEQVQHRATKIPASIRNMNYEDRVRKMVLTTLEVRRKRGDLIQCYKMLNNLDAVNLPQKQVMQNDFGVVGPASAIRGHKYIEIND